MAKELKKEVKVEKIEKVEKVEKVVEVPKVEPKIVEVGPIKDPDWAATSVVDPVTGIHLSAWRQEAVRKRDGK